MTLTRVLGMMSGTSMDGIDLALIETDGGSTVRFGPTGYSPYEPADRALLREAVFRAAQMGIRESKTEGVLAQAERMVTLRHAEAAERFLLAHADDFPDVDLVGFHGQTVLHRPREGVTLQLGDGAALAARLRLPVVYDFRSEDVSAGGEGAPLAPAFHQALVEAANLPKPVVVLNLGGVANITFAPEHGDPLACDTGPANALIDDLMLARTGEACDRDGATAARGSVDEHRLAQLLDHPYFDLPAPKSLDRNAFSSAPVADLATQDAAATLTAFTAESVARMIKSLSGNVQRVVVCGGGARNPALMGALQARLPCLVQSADELGWSADAMEAQAFAYLAVRVRRGLPLTFPMTTGAPRPLTGGVIAEPASV